MSSKAPRLIEKRDGKGELLFTLEHDRFGHTERRVLGNGETQSFRYDARGRVTEAFTDKHRYTFAYEVRGRRVEDKRDGLGVEHRFAGEHLARTTVLDRFVTRYRTRPGPGGDEVTEIVDPAGATHRIRRHGRGVVTKELANGLSETTQYHPRESRVLRRLVHEDGELRWERRYDYSGEGDLCEVRDTDRGLARFEHDAAHRLKAHVHPDGRRDEYEYNAAGALFRSPTIDGTIGAGNVLRYANGDQFEYSHRHHVAKRSGPRGDVTYDYDPRGHLEVVFWQGCNGQQWGWDAEYDPLGRRVRKSPGYNDHHAYYWDTDRLAAEVFPDGRLRVYVYPDAFGMVPMLFLDYESVDADPASGRRGYVFTDQRSCVERVLDDEQNDLWRARLDPYGTAHVEVGRDFHQPLRFPGHFHDPELGLHYNRFRYYSPELGRYLQTDPWGLRGEGPNLYAYTFDPLTQVDPRGLGCPKKGQDGDEGDGPEGGPDAESPAQRRARVRAQMGLDADGLTPTQRATYERMRQQDVWRARRYRYLRARENYGEPALAHGPWRAQAEQNIQNQQAGSEQEGRARDGLGRHLGRELDDSNAAESRVQEGGTRPDSVGRDSDGDVDLVHDHKHLSGEDQTVYDTEQMRRQRELAGDGEHVVTMSSDSPDLGGDPPRPRPSGPLADPQEGSTVLYTDSESGDVTHEWVPATADEPGRWDPID